MRRYSATQAVTQRWHPAAAPRFRPKPPVPEMAFRTSWTRVPARRPPLGRRSVCWARLTVQPGNLPATKLLSAGGEAQRYSLTSGRHFCNQLPRGVMEIVRDCSGYDVGLANAEPVICKAENHPEMPRLSQTPKALASVVPTNWYNCECAHKRESVANIAGNEISNTILIRRILRGHVRSPRRSSSRSI